MKYALSFFVGALVGSLIALLFAPSSGKDLRSNIKTRADSGYAKLQDGWQKGMQELHTQMERMGGGTQELANQTIQESGNPAS